jgi:hypothetical protein
VAPAGLADIALSSAVLMVFSSLVLLFTRNRRLRLGIFGYSLVLFLFAISRFEPWAFLPLAGDDGYYFLWAAEIADVLEGEANDSGKQIWPGKGVWPVVIALTHLFVEDAFLAPLAITTIASVSTILSVHRATQLTIGHSPPPFVLALLILLQPAFLGWGPTLNREVFFWLGTSLLVLGFAYYIRESYLKALSSGVAGAVLVIGIRYEVGIPLAYLMLCAALIYFVSSPPVAMTGRRFYKWLIASPVWAFSTLVTAFGFLWARNPSLFSLIPVAAEVEELYLRNEVNRRYLGRDEVTTAFQVSENPILGVIEGAFRAVFGPFPSEMGASLVWWILALSTLNFLLVLVLAMVFLFSSRLRFFEYSGLALAALGCIVIIAFAITNYGMVMRFRFVSQILLIPLAIGGYLVLRQKFLDFRSERGNLRPALAA